MRPASLTKIARGFPAGKRIEGFSQDAAKAWLPPVVAQTASGHDLGSAPLAVSRIVLV
ncbi:hypothetical protein [Paradevosia shaoguanensis]|uniref:hypothetical protein n=1 Tax=Paradevosia shaoguanensis TaxID=1335043 RepID=UPI003C780C48